MRFGDRFFLRSLIHGFSVFFPEKISVKETEKSPVIGILSEGNLKNSQLEFESLDIHPCCSRINVEFARPISGTIKSSIKFLVAEVFEDATECPTSKIPYLDEFMAAKVCTTSTRLGRACKLTCKFDKAKRTK